MEPGDIAFKCNFATLDTSSGIVISRRADRKFEDIGPRLCADLNGVALTCCHCLTNRVRDGEDMPVVRVEEGYHREWQAVHMA